VETDASFRAVLHEAFARCDDYAALLVTGDLVHDDGDGYLRFRSLLGHLRQPVLCVPGNHDVAVVMQRELAIAPFQVCGSRRIGAWQFVMLDSYAPGRVGGRLAPIELARLDETLACSPAHAMVCLHHHPIAMGSRWLDDIGLANADEFWRVIDSHSHVRAVVWGHVHQAHDGRRGDLRLFATPSTGAQFRPDSDDYAIDQRPPAFRRFRLHADGRIDTQLHWVGSLPARQLASA
jgi:Icc protein